MVVCCLALRCVKPATVFSFLLCLKRKSQDPGRNSRKPSRFSKAPLAPSSMAGKHHIFSPTSSKIFSKARSPSLRSSGSISSKPTSILSIKVGNKKPTWISVLTYVVYFLFNTMHRYYLSIYNSICACRHTHTSISTDVMTCRAYSLVDGHGRDGIFIFDLQLYKYLNVDKQIGFFARSGAMYHVLSKNLYAVLEAGRLLSRAITKRHSTKR